MFQQQCHNHIVCLAIETALHVYKGQFSPWLGQFITSIHVMSCLNCLPERYSRSFQEFQKCIRKDIGFSLCTAPPLYHTFLYFRSVSSRIDWRRFWEWKAWILRLRTEGTNCKVTEGWGRVRGNERYLGITRSNRRGKTSLIFELDSTGEQSGTSYYSKSMVGAKAHEMEQR